MRKKIMIGTLTVALLLAMTSCGKNTASTEVSPVMTETVVDTTELTTEEVTEVAAEKTEEETEEETEEQLKEQITEETDRQEETSKKEASSDKESKKEENTSVTKQSSSKQSETKKTDTGKETKKKTETAKDSEKKTTEESKSTSHKHQWEAQYKTVHHPAKTHKEKILVEDEYDDGIYEDHVFCNGCGLDLTVANLGSDLAAGIADHCHVCHGGTGYHSAPVQIGTKHHEARYKTVTITDQEAWDEEVLTGYKCTTCGKKKTK